MAACDTNDLLAQIDRCLSNRGDAVMEAVFLASLCQFITFLEGEGGEAFACDIATEVEESHCLASQGRANVRSAILIKLCELFTVLGQQIGPGLSFLHGHGHPEGVTQGNQVGQSYLDLDTGNTHWFAGTVGTNIGWIP